MFEPSGNLDLTLTLCRKQKYKSPDQKCCFLLGNVLLLQCIGISAVICRAAWWTFRPQAPKIKKLIFPRKKISSYFEEYNFLARSLKNSYIFPQKVFFHFGEWNLLSLSLEKQKNYPHITG